MVRVPCLKGVGGSPSRRLSILRAIRRVRRVRPVNGCFSHFGRSLSLSRRRLLAFIVTTYTKVTGVLSVIARTHRRRCTRRNSLRGVNHAAGGRPAARRRRSMAESDRCLSIAQCAGLGARQSSSSKNFIEREEVVASTLRSHGGGSVVTRVCTFEITESIGSGSAILMG